MTFGYAKARKKTGWCSRILRLVFKTKFISCWDHVFKPDLQISIHFQLTRPGDSKSCVYIYEGKLPCMNPWCVQVTIVVVYDMLHVAKEYICFQ